MSFPVRDLRCSKLMCSKSCVEHRANWQSNVNCWEAVHLALVWLKGICLRLKAGVNSSENSWQRIQLTYGIAQSVHHGVDSVISIWVNHLKRLPISWSLEKIPCGKSVWPWFSFVFSRPDRSTFTWNNRMGRKCGKYPSFKKCVTRPNSVVLTSVELASW